MRGQEEGMQEACGKLYTKDVVIQDCNAYIKQVSSNMTLSKSNLFLIESILY